MNETGLRMVEKGTKGKIKLKKTGYLYKDNLFQIDYKLNY